MTLQHLTPPAPRPPADRSPLDQRHDLGKRLRALRLQAGLTGVQLAGRLDCHSSKISRIEHGNAIPSPSDVRAWCMATGHDDQADDLAAQAANVEVAYTTWRSLQQTGGLMRLQQNFTDLFEQTRRWRVYEPRVLPGILQTRAYTAAILEVTRRRLDRPDDVSAAAAARYELRRVLDGPATFSYIVEEHVLREPVVGPEEMREQAEQLIADSRRPNVSIGVVPLGFRRRHAVENFSIHDDELVRVQLMAGLWTATAPGDIAEYADVFALLSEMAVYGDNARDLIRAAVG